ncbi:MAG: DUF1566 domain-containing protein [Candidatus Electrothrix scaldis]|nr:MAG: DUF1566 domain-containing protein [Candidatus Electrothrix sp. GW3-3]
MIRRKPILQISWLVLFLLLIALPTAAQQEAGYGRFHAVVIGNQHYKHLKELHTPLADAEAVAEVLQNQYGFTVEVLLDKPRNEIMLALSKLRKTMTSEEDNLLIYYAGHGYLDKETGTGYWLPINAEKDNPVYWIPTDDITRLLRAIRARHVLVVADSCYSGSLLMREAEVRLPRGMEPDRWLARMQARRSRTALTSGGEEPVRDGGGSGHSVFAKALLEVLQENQGILDGDTLFDRIKRPIILNAEQTPLYGDIRMTNHDGGDFLLVPKGHEVSVVQTKGGAQAADSRQRGSETASSPPSEPPAAVVPKAERMPQKDRTIGQYIDHGDGTVTDTKTGLMWKRCSEGLSGVNCEDGEIEKYSWDDAVQRFKNVEYAGYKDWRLPTIDELKTLVHCSKGQHKDDYCMDGSKVPTINQQAFPNTETFVWSGSPDAAYSIYAWLVIFGSGSSGSDFRTASYAVRLVRGGR